MNEINAKEKEVTIVTAFFDIGRKHFEGNFSRDNQKYLDYFKFWARIKNKVVCYTDSITAKEVINIRKEFGLEAETRIVVIDDYTTIEPEMLARMQEVANNDEFLKYRYMPNPADNNPTYDYVMLLKSWCLSDTVKKGLADGMLCWLDFGFNHGGDVFTREEEFDFDLKVNFPEDKIVLFNVITDDNKPIFHIVQSYDVYIMGAPMYVPAKHANDLLCDVKEAMNSLLDVGFIDDDQTLLFMAARKHKERYSLIKSDWFMPLKEYGGQHLTLKEKTKKSSLKDKLLHLYRKNKRNRKCMRNLKSLFWQ